MARFLFFLLFDVIVWSYRLKLLFEVIVWSLQQEKPQRQRRRFTRAWLKKKKKRLGNQAELVKPGTEWLGSENISESKKTKQKKSKEKSHSRIPTN